MKADDEAVRRYLTDQVTYLGEQVGDGYVSRRLYALGCDGEAQAETLALGIAVPEVPPPIRDDELTSHPRIVVLGNAGAGKSWVVARAFSAAARAWLSGMGGLVPLWLDLGRLGSDGDVARTLEIRTGGLWSGLRGARAGHTALFMDGIDEALARRAPAFVDDVWQFLAEQCSGLASLVLACRRSVWRAELVQGLEPPFKLYSVDYLERECYARLLPEEAQREAFLRQCRDAGADALLRNPFDGFFLARRFARGESLPRTRGALLSERVSESISGATPPAGLTAPSGTLRQAACGIAAAATFCGRASWSQQDVVDWLCGGEGAGMGAGEVQWLLSRALFTSDGQEFRFAHELIREWLCAEALERIPLPKQRQLLQTAMPGSDEVAPRFRGVASFLAELSPAYRDHLVAADPLTASMADTGCLPQAEDEALLNRVVRGCIEDGVDPYRPVNSRGDEPRHALRKHRPADATGFVLPLLKSEGTVGMLWGLACVDAWGASGEALAALRDMALDASLDSPMRGRAAHAVADSGDARAIRSLYSLLDTGDDWTRGPVLEAWRSLEQPTPAEYIGKLRGGARNPELLGWLARHVSEYGHGLSRAQLGDAFAAMTEEFEALGDLRGVLLRGLLERAREIGFATVPPQLVLQAWGACPLEGMPDDIEPLEALMCEHPSLLASVFEHVRDGYADPEGIVAAWEASKWLGSCAPDTVLDLFPQDPATAQRDEGAFYWHVLRAFWAHEQTPERLARICERLPAWGASLSMPPPPEQPPEPDRDAEAQTLLTAAGAAPGNAIATAHAVFRSLQDVLGLPRQSIPTPDEVVGVLSRHSPEVRRRVLEAFGACVLAATYVRTREGDESTITHPLYALMFRTVRRAGVALPASKLAEVLACYGFDGLEHWGDADEVPEMMEELRAADTVLWSETVTRLLDESRTGTWRAADYLISVDSGIYSARCAERLCTGDYEAFDLDWLLRYLSNFRPDEYRDVLRACYRLLRRVFPAPGLGTAGPTPPDSGPTIAHEANSFDYWWQLGPLFLLMAEDDDWAWDEFAARLAAGDIPLDDRDHVLISRWPAPLEPEPSRCGILADWYAALRRDAPGDDLFHGDWAKFVMRAIHAVGGTEAIRELQHLRRERAFAGWEYLGGEIRTLRDAMLDAVRQSPRPAELVGSLDKARNYVVGCERDLMEVVCAAVEEVAEEFTAGEGVAAYWNSDEPKHEAECQNGLWPALRARLTNRGLAVQEERHVGANRCDWWVELPRRGEEPFRVAVELKVAMKGYARREIIAPVRRQLVEKYMTPGRLSFGVFIVLWFRDPQRYDYPAAWASAEELRQALAAECERASQQHAVTVRGYVLDVTSPARRR